MNLNLRPSEMDEVMHKFKKALNIEETENKNVYIHPLKIQKIKIEIKRLRLIAREFRHDMNGEWAQDMIEILEKEINLK
tara:strand:- start:314 stop:550 length:237 start_codon:yes stop_codon:yes gene_type:complete